MQEKTDVLIIGGGIIGVCAAHYLSQSGQTVRIVEKGELGAACSSGNAGLIVPSHVIRLARPGVLSQGMKWLLDPKSPFYIQPRLDPALISWLWKFMRACSREQMQASIPILHNLLQESYKLYESLARSLDFGWTKKGLLMICNSEQGLEHEISDVALAREAGLDVKMLNREEIRKLEPNIEIDATGGAYYTQDTHIDPALLIQRLVENFDPQKVKIHTNTEAVGFEINGSKIRGIKTTAQIFFADEIIIAGGTWSPVIGKQLGIRIPIQAGKGCSVTLAEPKRLPEIPFILTEAKIAVTPMRRNLRFAGTMVLAPPDANFSRDRVHAMLDKIPGYLPEINPEQLKKLNAWVGSRPCTPDGLPIISKTNRYENLIIATGHAMLGISLAPVTAILVRKLLEKSQPEIDFQPLSLSRFN